MASSLETHPYVHAADASASPSIARGPRSPRNRGLPPRALARRAAAPREEPPAPAPPPRHPRSTARSLGGVVIDHQAAHAQSLARPRLHAPRAIAGAEHVTGDPKQPLIGPALGLVIAVHPLERPGERLGGQVRRQLGTASAKKAIASRCSQRMTNQTSLTDGDRGSQPAPRSARVSGCGTGAHGSSSPVGLAPDR
jgi:hypothetical protein